MKSTCYDYDKKSNFNEYQNDVTKALNFSLKSEYKSCLRQHYTEGHYMLFSKDNPKSATIRFPGATRGYVTLDENDIIQSFTMYPDYVSEIYKKSVIKYLNKFIGQELTWPEGEDR